MQFLAGVMGEYESNPSVENAYRMDGALYALGSIHRKVEITVQSTGAAAECDVG